MPTDNQQHENELKLYVLLVDQLQKYSTIVWQVPTALAAVNILALDKFANKPWNLLVIALFNAAMIYAFYKMVLRQREIIRCARGAEEELSKLWNKFIPTFTVSDVPATFVVIVMLSFFDLCLFIYAMFAVLCWSSA